MCSAGNELRRSNAQNMFPFAAPAEKGAYVNKRKRQILELYDFCFLYEMVFKYYKKLSCPHLKMITFGVDSDLNQVILEIYCIPSSLIQIHKCFWIQRLAHAGRQLSTLKWNDLLLFVLCRSPRMVQLTVLST